MPLERLKPDLSIGLTKEQVEDRIAHAAVNVLVDTEVKTLKDIVKENLFTYFNLIFLIIAILLCVVGSFRDLTFLPIIIANILIGTFQEWKSKQTLDKLSILSSPKTKAIRDGSVQTLQSDELVLDEIVIFEPGNQIPADAVVESGEVQVNESLITGEADEIVKKPGDSLLSGSFIVSGQCKARLDKVGADSYVSKLTLEAKEQKQGEESEMIRSLDGLVKLIGILIIPIGILLFSQQYFINDETFRNSVTATVAAVIGMIPEGLYLLASVAMAVSVMRLAMNKVLVHNMKSIETLARVDVLCVDKTGTITENVMTVQQVIPLHAAVKTEMQSSGQGTFSTDISASDVSAENGAALEAEVSKAGAPQAESAAGASASASSEHIGNAAPSVSLPQQDFTPEELAVLEMQLGDFVAGMNTDNVTMQAMQNFFKKNTGRKPDQIFTFSSATKYSGAVFGEKNYVLGAPEFLLREDYSIYQSLLEQYSSKGYRVLIFGEYQGALDGKVLQAPVLPKGMVLLANPIREKAPDTFRYFKEQGVTVKVISGDNPVTVSHVAMEAGIDGAEKYIDAVTLKTEEDVLEAADQYTVFGRVTPEQKRQLVRALKHHGHTVAMTGDGVNDVLALKDADCSIAMASGSDAAAHAAQMVLLESDFSKMPSVVAEGRRVVNNIERTASLFLVKNIFSLLMSIFSIVFMVNYPLEPSQISLISMFTIGIPAFMMSLEQNRNRIKGHFLSNVFFRALPAGLTDFAVISGLVVFCQVFEVSDTDVSTSCTILLAIVGIMILYRIASPMTKYHWVLWFTMIFGLLFCMIFMNQIFAITTLSKKCAMLLIIFAIITEPGMRYLSLLIQKIWDMGRWIKKKWSGRKMARAL
ncbi:MAG: HAD-IC family P-type ATPase [Lachnospiraceae bacterium]|nr:HAD-IC family P-type ATPase [Lachnospiraceae bacterium]